MRQRRSARSPSTRRPSDRASTDRLPIDRQRTDLESPPASEAVGSAQEVAFRERQVDHALRDNRSKLQSPRQHDCANRLVITPGREHVVVAERPGQPSACVFHSNGSAIAGSRTQRLDSRAAPASSHGLHRFSTRRASRPDSHRNCRCNWPPTLGTSTSRSIRRCRSGAVAVSVTR